MQTPLPCVRGRVRPRVRKMRRASLLLLLIFCLVVLCPRSSSFAAEIRGSVVGIRGQPLARVQLTILETQRHAITGDDGRFTIAGLAPGHYTLQANAVGYWLINVPFALAPDEAAKEFAITLTPDNSTRTETVKVTGDLFQGSDSPAVVKTNLTPEEIRQTSTVLADDPFRSIQTLPGVSAAGNDDFLAQFSVMGAPYQEVAIYIDGILVPAPFHGVEITETEGATLSIFTSETLQEINLLPAAYPEKYGDDVGAALQLETRDGSRDAPVFRLAAGLADSEADGEGPLGRRKQGSWLASARKSYLGWLFLGRLNDTSDSVSFDDADLKLDYDLSPTQRVDLYAVGGPTTYRLIHPPMPPDPNEIDRVTDNFILGRAGWRWTANPRLLVEAHAAHFQQPNDESNAEGRPLDDSHYAEWVAAGSVISSWRKEQTLEGGWMARRAGTNYTQTYYIPSGAPSQDAGNAEGWKNDGYLEQSSTLFGSRLHLEGGLRIDTAALFHLHPVSPQLSGAWQLAPSTQVQLAFGRYHQFDFPAYTLQDLLPNCSLTPESLMAANHYVAELEQRVGESTQVRVMLFNRSDQLSVGQNVSGTCPVPLQSQSFQPVSHDYSRGAQIVLQSRNTNRLSGWIGYTLAYARQNFYTAGASPALVPASWSSYYPTLADQRNTLNLFASYRLTPTLNLGGKFLFGSGYPVPDGDINPIRLGDYQRLDLRAEKDWAFRRWKLAAYAELLNAANHDNPLYFYTSDAGSVVTGQGLPITPTAGVAFEF